MVPLSGRRHRLYDSEIPEVIIGLNLRLKQLLLESKDAEKAETAYRCMHRLLGNKKGRPKYPNYNSDESLYIIEAGEEELLAYLDEMRTRSTNAKSV